VVVIWIYDISSFNVPAHAMRLASDELTPEVFNFDLGLGAATFQVEVEYLDSRLYVAYFAAQGVAVIDASDDKCLLPIVLLPYEPKSITTKYHYGR